VYGGCNDPDSRVDIRATVVADLRGIARLGRALATGALPLATLRAQLGRHPLDPPGVPTRLTRQAVRGLPRRPVTLVRHGVLPG